MKRLAFLTLSLLSFGTALMIENSSLKNLFVRADVNTLLQERLANKLEVQKQILTDSSILRMVDGFDVRSDLYKEFKSEKLAVFAYKHKCLVFWSDNIIQAYNFNTDKNLSSTILRNNNGWYQMVSLKKGDYDLYCYYKFYHQFPFNNEYFDNAFCRELHLEDVQLAVPEMGIVKQSGGFEIHENLPLVDQSDYSGKIIRQSVEFFYVASFILFIFFIVFYARNKNDFNTRKAIVLFSGYVGLVNILAFFDIILKHKSDIPLFEPELAAYSDFVPSLGHCILFSMALLCTLVFVHQSLPVFRLKESSRMNSLKYVLVSTLHWLVLFFILLQVLPVYILNSRINYDFKILTNVNEYTLIGMYNIFLLFLFILLCNRIIASLVKHQLNKRKFVSFHSAIGAVLLAIAYFLFQENGFLLLCVFAYGMILPLGLLFVRRVMFRHIMAAAMLSAAAFSVQFEQLNSFKEKEHRKLFANKLIAKEDIDLEIKLLNIEEEMIHEMAIDSFFYYKRNDYQEIELNYQYTFFTDFIKNYDISLMRYDSFGNDISPNKLTYQFVNALYNQSTNKSITNYFLYIKDLHYLGGYLAKYEICPGERNIGYVFLLLTPKVKSDLYNLDYFFSSMDYNQITDNRYSYAIYLKGDLIRSLGSYPYKLVDYKRYEAMEDETFLNQNGYSQLLKKLEDETFIIVSLKSPSWNQIFTVFTFILLYFTSILLLVFVCIYLVILFIGVFSFNPYMHRLHDIITQYLRVININKLLLETKIRLSFLLISVLICSVVVYFTVQNVNKGFREKQNESLDKKMTQIVSELEFGYSKRDDRPIQNLIRHLANTNEVDINLYFKDGTLYQTANTRIYREGWFSPYIHPNAHYELIQMKQYNVKQYEKIGRLEYQSYYNALFDESRNLIGYVHLPYFSKSIDLKREFSTYLGSLLNMSTLLLMISLLIASYFGQSLVRPLNLMTESLARIKLGARNKAIDWSRNDEIGQLVEQYNIMLKQLEVNTDKLAQSEREGAWKEMAKQVAHEIKNPLTPMKLHLQHLQMAINRNDENLKDKISHISQILIEQIDQLSHMAEEFSNFAKMPMALPEICNINQVLKSAITLFRAQNDIEIHWEESDETIPVLIDKDQMQRVFTNILKNAQQAAKEDEKCRINVHVDVLDDIVSISFTDNGKGIKDELKEKIFQPNFSTKNSGMGLGLAICKKIVEQVNGNITFESEVNKGTIFRVILPVYKTDSPSIL